MYFLCGCPKSLSNSKICLLIVARKGGHYSKKGGMRDCFTGCA